MIYEYAVEPKMVAEMVASWDPNMRSWFLREFKPGKGRIVAGCPGPKSWKKRVWNGWRKRIRDAGKGLDQTWVEVTIQQMVECMNARSVGSWDGDVSWLTNACREHDERVPFHGIIARDNPDGHQCVLTEDTFDDSKLWDVTSGVRVCREANAMARAIAPALRNSMEVIFVDPYFNPSERRFRRPFLAFLDQMFQNRPCGNPKIVEYHADQDKSKLGSRYFRQECEKLSQGIPDRVTVTFRRLKEESRGETLHDRFVLTDIGGIGFGQGLDESSSAGNASKVNVQLLGEEIWEGLWKLHRPQDPWGDSPPPGFGQREEPVRIEGEREGIHPTMQC